MEENNRRDPRVVVDVYALLQKRQGKYIHVIPNVCTVHNLSVSGACISTTEQLDVGDCVQIILQAPASPKRITLFGNVVWQRSGGSRDIIYGLQLYLPDGTLSPELKEMVSKLLPRM